MLHLWLAAAAKADCGLARLCHAAADAAPTERTVREQKAMEALLPACEKAASGAAWRAKALDALTRARTGTALIIGANSGFTATDPMYEHFRHRLGHVDKVFVEPVPALARALRQNISAMPRAVAVEAAVSPSADEPSGALPMYCLVDPETGRPDLRGTKLRTERREWWTEICSLDRARLFAEYDMHRDLGSRTKRLARAVRNLTVPALSVAELLRRHVRSPVRYVQVDVEGFDDRVVAQLPLQIPPAEPAEHDAHGGEARKGARDFRPAAITFEWVLLGEERFTAAVERLRAAGYDACHDGQNVAAVRRATHGAKADALGAVGGLQAIRAAALADV